MKDNHKITTKLKKIKYLQHRRKEKRRVAMSAPIPAFDGRAKKTKFGHGTAIKKWDLFADDQSARNARAASAAGPLGPTSRRDARSRP